MSNTLTSPSHLDLPHGLEDRYLNNYAALACLQSEYDKLNESSDYEYVVRVTRLHAVTKLLLDHFAEKGIIVTPRVQTNSAIIDLLVRMPDKRLFALMLRSSSGASVAWNEYRQKFFVNKVGQKNRKNDPLTRSISESQTIIDLKKERHPIVGASTNERNAPLIKAIVLAPGAKIAFAKSPTVQAQFGDAPVLKIKTTSITYVVESENLINFLLPVQK